MRRCLVTLTALTLAGPAAAQPWTLERKLEPGARKQVVEVTESTVQRLWKGKHAKVGDAEASLFERRYSEEVRTAQPEVLVREYEHSARSKHHPQATPEPVRTSLHGRRVLVAGLEQKPDGPFEIEKDDREALRFDRLVLALLPPQRVVEARASWVVGPEPIVQALFGRYVSGANADGEAKVDLRAVKKQGGREVASLRVKVRVHLERSSSLPGFDLAMKGEVEWAVAEGTLLEARLEGPLTYVFGVGEGEVEATGTARWTYQATLLEPRAPAGAAARKRGEPPPPGTQALVCAHDPSHRYALAEIKRCTTCGKELDRDRRCPDGDPWVLQYCPRDGGPLEPGP